MFKKVLLTLSIVITTAFGAMFLIRLGKNQVCLENNCREVELAQNQQQWSSGLMFRENLEEKHGMLFIFDEIRIYGFWMKNTLIPLDLIWIDEAGKVVFIKENAQPCKTEICESFKPDREAKFVLEINAGESQKIGLKSGSQLISKFFK